MGFLDNLHWRYATKKYNGTPVSEENLAKIIEAIQYAPSSAGTQPYHVIVTSGALKNQLIQSSKQIDKLGASHLLVFCSRVDYPERAQQQLENTAAIQGVSMESLAGLRSTVEGTVNRSVDSLRPWAARQAYIALGFALAAAAELNIDASPMEGFSPSEFKQILQLPDYMDPVVIMGLGYRSDDDAMQHRKKVRFPKDDLFEFRQ